MPKFGAVVSIDKLRATGAAPVREAVLEHLDGLYRFALRLTRDVQLAKELTQESALRALEQQKTIIRDLRAWLFQTLYHTFINQYRRGLREEAASVDSPEIEVAGHDFSNPLPSLIAVEDVRSALEALPHDLRTVVWLFDAEEFRLREIADILGWPVGTVASRLWRARQALRQRLAAYRQPPEKQT